MATATARKTISIHDYPEHLNPFREDEEKTKFWTLGRRLSRSNSINFTGIKDLKNSWAFRSFMKKGSKKKEKERPQQDLKQEKPTHVNGDSSPIVFRRALQYSQASRSTVGVSPSDRYVYGGSVTPLPRSRFQERLRSSSHFEVSTPRLARSEAGGSRLSVESSNPFEEPLGPPPVPPVRASRRKKKKAPPPPPGALDASITSETSELQSSAESSALQTIIAEDKKPDGDLDIDEMKIDVELKIVEDEDVKDKNQTANNTKVSQDKEAIETTDKSSTAQNEDKSRETPEPDENFKSLDSIENILKSVEFPKVDIIKYRRNSSVNEDDIRLRRGNLEDFHSLSAKRSKSLNNTMDSNYITYDINLNEKEVVDSNGNSEPQKVVCKLFNEMPRKQSVETISSTEKEFLEIDKVRREFESEINKLNAALEEDFSPNNRLSVSEIKKRFDKNDTIPNPIPKPRRSHYSDSGSPVNGNIPS